MRVQATVLFLCASSVGRCEGLIKNSASGKPRWGHKGTSTRSSVHPLHANKETRKVFDFEDTDRSSRGLVSSLTGIVNFFSGKVEEANKSEKDVALYDLPTSPNELMERIGKDYTEKNYLWTGDIDLACFDNDCKFTDPTISFVGRSKFVNNVKNLKVIVDALAEPGDCRSDLLSIDVTEKYVQSRWNMVGKLTGLPWQPTIDVIGRTRFWFKKSDAASGGYQVYLYDECWEMPASKALLQLVTPSK